MTVEIVNPRASRSSGAITVQEVDGNPLAGNVNVLKLTNNTVTDNGDGSVTLSVGTGVGNGDVSGPAASVDGEVALFSGTGGKTLKRSTLTGLLKSAAGVLQAATPGTDYTPATTGTSILKGNNAGGTTAAIAGTDYLTPTGNGSQLTNLTKAQVGLSNVDNTSDTNKPISSATQTALDLKAPLDSPSFTGDINITFGGFDNLTIDGRTNPRQITLGVVRVNHTAGVTGTRQISLDIDANGFSNTHAFVIDYKATGIGNGGSENHLMEVNVDTANSTGGEIQAMSVSKSGTGSATVTAIEILPDVNVLVQKVGDPIALTQAWLLSSAVYTDSTTAFSNGTNVGIFANDNDYIICGSDNLFQQIEVYLSTMSSNTIDAIFEYSTGPGTWQAFSPSDGTNGFTTNGSIMWPTLAGWVSAAVNGVSKYYIRIQRTRNLIVTTPIESNIRIRSTTDYWWDKDGDIYIRKLRMSGTPVYADNTAAIAGGLLLGETYRTSAGVLMEVY